MTYELTGKCSNFGGPNDHGVSPSEGLALYDQSDIGWAGLLKANFKNPHDLFLYQQPQGTTGIARRLDPTQYYIACRWNYSRTPLNFLRNNQVTVVAGKTGKSFHAWPADWGPNVNTGRIADLSPGLMKALGIDTDDIVTVIIPEPTKPELSRFQKFMMAWDKK